MVFKFSITQGIIRAKFTHALKLESKQWHQKQTRSFLNSLLTSLLLKYFIECMSRIPLILSHVKMVYLLAFDFSHAKRLKKLASYLLCMKSQAVSLSICVKG